MHTHTQTHTQHTHNTNKHTHIHTHRNSVRLAIRKIQFAPDKKGPQPTAEVQKLFLMSDKPLNLEASLDKDVRALAPVFRSSDRMCLWKQRDVNAHHWVG